MNRAFKIYSIVWGMCLLLFHGIVFALPSPARQAASFWVGHLFIVIAFVGQLACTHYALKNDGGHKLFYSVPLILVSYVGVAAMLVFGSLPVLFPSFPFWLSIMLCVAVLACSISAVVITGGVGEMVSKMDKQVKTATHTFRMLTADAEHLMSEATTEELRSTAKRVYEAIRYSDVVSGYALIEINERIQAQFAAFADSVRSGDTELAAEVAMELLTMIDERNKKCRMMK